MKHEIDFNWRSQDNNEKENLEERFFLGPRTTFSVSENCLILCKLIAYDLNL